MRNVSQSITSCYYTTWGRRRKKLLDDLKDRRGYSHLKEEALDRTMWRNRFRGGFGPVVRQNTEWTSCYYTTWKHWLSSLSHYALLETLHVFSLSVAAELSVAATNRCTPVPPTVNTPAPRQTHPPQLLDYLPVWGSVVINGKFLLN